MNQITGHDLSKISHLYDRYDSNRAVIFSVLEGQYDGCAYVNDGDDFQWAVLRTPFLQHFVAGRPTPGCASTLEDILFNTILPEQQEKEIVVFADSALWDDILTAIFAEHHGVSDGRKIFAFCHENHAKLKQPPLPADVQPMVEKGCNHPGSHRDAWSAKLLVAGQVVSCCDALMVGSGMAEIDISTLEAFRGRGYATLATMMLIDQLLKEGLTPSWSTWPFRVESQHIAQKLGFIPMPDAKAWIWVEGM